MTNDQPTQPLTDAELQRTILARRRGAVQSLNGCDCVQPDSHGIVLDSLGDIPRLLAEVDRLRTENAAARKLHQPVTVDWSASPKCKASHGPSWVNWPCPDAFALGMRSKDYDA